eukprot:jgi/Botrbrau1/8052/Bobra.13_2s0021.1
MNPAMNLDSEMQPEPQAPTQEPSLRIVAKALRVADVSSKLLPVKEFIDKVLSQDLTDSEVVDLWCGDKQEWDARHDAFCNVKLVLDDIRSSAEARTRMIRYPFGETAREFDYQNGTLTKLQGLSIRKGKKLSQKERRLRKKEMQQLMQDVDTAEWDEPMQKLEKKLIDISV